MEIPPQLQHSPPVNRLNLGKDQLAYEHSSFKTSTFGNLLRQVVAMEIKKSVVCVTTKAVTGTYRAEEVRVDAAQLRIWTQIEKLLTDTETFVKTYENIP